jgi:hypothetical protein
MTIDRDADGTRRRAWAELDARQQADVRHRFLPVQPYEAFRYEIGRDGRTVLSRKPRASPRPAVVWGNDRIVVGLVDERELGRGP